MTMYKKMIKSLRMLRFFGTREWNFKNENTVRLIEQTKSFNYQNGTLMEFDARNIDWKKYAETYLDGIMKCAYLLESKRKKKQKTKSS